MVLLFHGMLIFLQINLEFSKLAGNYNKTCGSWECHGRIVRVSKWHHGGMEQRVVLTKVCLPKTVSKLQFFSSSEYIFTTCCKLFWNVFPKKASSRFLKVNRNCVTIFKHVPAYNTKCRLFDLDDARNSSSTENLIKQQTECWCFFKCTDGKHLR